MFFFSVSSVMFIFFPMFFVLFVCVLFQVKSLFPPTSHLPVSALLLPGEFVVEVCLAGMVDCLCPLCLWTLLCPRPCLCQLQDYATDLPGPSSDFHSTPLSSWLRWGTIPFQLQIVSVHFAGSKYSNPCE